MSGDNAGTSTGAGASGKASSKRPQASSEGTTRKAPGGGWRNSKMVRGYLVVYNCLMTYAWSSLLYHLLVACYKTVMSGKYNYRLVHKMFASHLTQLEMVTVLEVFHAGLSLTPSHPCPSTLQFAGRMAAVGLAGIGTAELKGNDNCHLAFIVMSIAWSLADITRYLYYVQGWLLGGRKVGGGLTWARYSLFLVLYPIGFVAEAFLFNALRLVKASEKNPMQYWILGYLCIFPVAFLMMYWHMLKQRSRNL